MAYDLFADQSKQLVSLEQYTAYFASLAPYEIKSYSFPDVHVQGEKANVVVDLVVSSSAGDEKYQVTQQIVREDGSWRVVMRDAQLASFTDTATSSESAASSDSPDSESVGKHYDATVTVSRVVDGDTVETTPAINGVEDVRLIGVDTPETVDPGEEVEPYGPEASAFATEELAGQKLSSSSMRRRSTSTTGSWPMSMQAARCSTRNCSRKATHKPIRIRRTRSTRDASPMFNRALGQQVSGSGVFPSASSANSQTEVMA
jgi:hypothetical protein